MQLWITDEAYRKYVAYCDDIPVRDAFDEIIRCIKADAHVGSEVDLIELSDDPWERRAADAIRGATFMRGARIHIVEVERAPGALPPPVLAVAIHVPHVPRGVDADHTILVFGLLLRQRRDMV